MRAVALFVPKFGGVDERKPPRPQPHDDAANGRDSRLMDVVHEYNGVWMHVRRNADNTAWGAV